MPTNRLAEKEKVLTYASVLLDGALAEGGQAVAMAVRDQADEIVRIMRANPALTEALKNTAYTAEERNALARGVFEGVDGALVDVLAVMAERGDTDLLTRVCSAFEDAIQEKLNVTIVDVTTAVALDDLGGLSRIRKGKLIVLFGDHLIVVPVIFKIKAEGRKIHPKRSIPCILCSIDNGKSGIGLTVSCCL